MPLGRQTLGSFLQFLCFRSHIEVLFRRSLTKSNMTIDTRLHRIVTAQPDPLLFATISALHLYGFPSPDSDYDLRGAHVLPLDAVVGLEVRDETVEDSPAGDRLEMHILNL